MRKPAAPLASAVCSQQSMGFPCGADQLQHDRHRLTIRQTRCRPWQGRGKARAVPNFIYEMHTLAASSVLGVILISRPCLTHSPGLQASRKTCLLLKVSICLSVCGPRVQPDARAEDEGGYCSSVPEKLTSGQILSKPWGPNFLFTDSMFYGFQNLLPWSL